MQPITSAAAMKSLAIFKCCCFCVWSTLLFALSEKSIQVGVRVEAPKCFLVLTGEGEGDGPERTEAEDAREDGGQHRFFNLLVATFCGKIDRQKVAFRETYLTMIELYSIESVAWLT